MALLSSWALAASSAACGAVDTVDLDPPDGVEPPYLLLHFYDEGGGRLHILRTLADQQNLALFKKPNDDLALVKLDERTGERILNPMNCDEQPLKVICSDECAARAAEEVFVFANRPQWQPSSFDQMLAEAQCSSTERISECELESCISSP